MPSRFEIPMHSLPPRLISRGPELRVASRRNFDLSLSSVSFSRSGAHAFSLRSSGSESLTKEKEKEEGERLAQAGSRALGSHSKQKLF
jgi:hypothetical protein